MPLECLICLIFYYKHPLTTNLSLPNWKIQNMWKNHSKPQIIRVHASKHPKNLDLSTTEVVINKNLDLGVYNIFPMIQMSLNQNPINEEGLNHLVIPPPDYSSLEPLHLCRVATHLLSESERERERERWRLFGR